MSLIKYVSGGVVGSAVVSSVLFEDVDKKNWIYQPNSIRWRHRYRGPRESLKISQELAQTYYDLNALIKRLKIVNTNLGTIVDEVLDGGPIDGAEYNWLDDATISDQTMILMGLDNMTAELESLRKRVELLEGH